MQKERPIEKTERLLKLTEKILNKIDRKPERIAITATELLKLNPTRLKWEGQSNANDSGDYEMYYSINDVHYLVKSNLFR